MKVERPDHIAVPIADLRRRMRAVEASTLSAIRAVAAPAATVYPLQTGGSVIGRVYETPGISYLGNAGFIVPAGGWAMSIVGVLVCETHWWNNDTGADAWLEVVGQVASSRTHCAGAYLDVVTVNKTVAITLPAGTYIARWGLQLGAGNQIQITGGSIAVWQT